MSGNLSTYNQRETLKDRLAKRHNVRSKNVFDKTPVDESEITSINHSPTITQSLDRRTSQHTNRLSSIISSTTSVDQRKSSSITIKDPKLRPTEDTYWKQNYLPSIAQTSSTHFLEQEAKSQSFESENHEEALSKSLPTKEQQNYPYYDEKPVIIQKTVSPISSPVVSLKNIEKSDPVPQETDNHNEEPVATNKIISPKLPSIIRPRTAKTPNPVKQEADEDSHSYHDENLASPKLPPVFSPRVTKTPIPIEQVMQENPIRNQNKDLSQNSSDHSQSNTDVQQKHFNFPPVYPNSVPRSSSEKIITINNRKHQPTDPKLTKPDSLALSYVFNKRMINAQVTRGSSLDSQQSQQKTVWD